MKDSLTKRIKKYLSDHKRRKRLFRTTGVLSLVVALGVFGMLRIPAVSREIHNPLIQTASEYALYGDIVQLKVSATAESGQPETVFLLSMQDLGAGLSEEYIFDANNETILEAESLNLITLHREAQIDGTMQYWFTLPENSTEKLTLNCTTPSLEAEAENPAATPAPTETPAAELVLPTAEPEPTIEPTIEPTTEPTAEPIAEPTAEPEAELDAPMTDEPVVETEAPLEPAAEAEPVTEAEPVAQSYSGEGGIVLLSMVMTEIAEPPADEPVIEEPVIEEPVIEEPIVEEPVAEESTPEPEPVATPEPTPQQPTATAYLRLSSVAAATLDKAREALDIEKYTTYTWLLTQAELDEARYQEAERRKELPTFDEVAVGIDSLPDAASLPLPVATPETAAETNAEAAPTPEPTATPVPEPTIAPAIDPAKAELEASGLSAEQSNGLFAPQTVQVMALDEEAALVLEDTTTAPGMTAAELAALRAQVVELTDKAEKLPDGDYAALGNERIEKLEALTAYFAANGILADASPAPAKTLAEVQSAIDALPTPEALAAMTAEEQAAAKTALDAVVEDTAALSAADYAQLIEGETGAARLQKLIDLNNFYYTAATPLTTAQEFIAAVNALPTVEELSAMPLVKQEIIKGYVGVLMNAMENLSDEDYAAVTSDESFAKLMELVNYAVPAATLGSYDGINFSYNAGTNTLTVSAGSEVVIPRLWFNNLIGGQKDKNSNNYPYPNQLSSWYTRGVTKFNLVIDDTIQALNQMAFAVSDTNYTGKGSPSGICNLTIGKNVSYIGDYAFTNCDLHGTTVKIPAKCTTLGYLAFATASLEVGKSASEPDDVIFEYNGTTWRNYYYPFAVGYQTATYTPTATNLNANRTSRTEYWKSMRRIFSTQLNLAQLRLDYSFNGSIGAPNGYESIRYSYGNGYTIGTNGPGVGYKGGLTWMTKSAKWDNYDNGTATLRIDYSEVYPTKTDFLFIVDSTFSMSRDANEQLTSSAKVFYVNGVMNTVLEQLGQDGTNRFATVVFNSGIVRYTNGFSTNAQAQMELIQQTPIYGDTPYDSPLDAALRLIGARGNQPDRTLNIIFLSDGIPNYQGNTPTGNPLTTYFASTQINALKAANATNMLNYGGYSNVPVNIINMSFIFYSSAAVGDATNNATVKNMTTGAGAFDLYYSPGQSLESAFKSSIGVISSKLTDVIEDEYWDIDTSRNYTIYSGGSATQLGNQIDSGKLTTNASNRVSYVGTSAQKQTVTWNLSGYSSMTNYTLLIPLKWNGAPSKFTDGHMPTNDDNNTAGIIACQLIGKIPVWDTSNHVINQIATPDLKRSFYDLPATGGEGVWGIYTTGFLLTAGSALLLYKQRRKKQGGETS